MLDGMCYKETMKKFLLIVASISFLCTLGSAQNEGDTDTDTELGRAGMRTELIEIPIEQFTISFMNKPKDKLFFDALPKTCTLRLDWEKTRAYVDIAEKK